MEERPPRNDYRHIPALTPRNRATTVRLGIVASAALVVVMLPAMLMGSPIGRAPGSTSSPAESQAAVSASASASFAAAALASPAPSFSDGSSSVPLATETPGADPSTTAPTSSLGTTPNGTVAPETTAAPTAHVTPPATPAPTSAPSSPPATVAGDLYVATNGSDSNPGTVTRPLRTVARAAAIASPGSTVYLRAGTYAGFDVTRSGITFTSYPGETATVSDGSRDDVIQFTGVSSGAVVRLVVQGSTVAYGSGIKIKNSSGVTVSRSTVRNNRTFGVVIVSSSNVHIDSNTITGNADGIEERYAGNGVLISNNKIHGNTKMVDSGRGMEGINFYKSTGSVTVTGNLLWDNGTHFEVYGASNLNITGNVTWNGQIMETGTDGPACGSNRFTRNIGYKGAGYQSGSTSGMILRCAKNMLVANNTLDGFDLFAFDIVDGTQGVAYGGSIAGLRILNNIAVGGRAFSIDSSLPSSVKIDYNLLYNVGSTAVYGNHLAWMKNVGQFDTLAAFRSATGYEAHGVFGDPRFVDWGGHNYHLRSGSPAIDAGTVVLSDGYSGAAPDIGRYEAG